MISTVDLDLSKEMMDRLADARDVLCLTLSNLPDTDPTLKQTVAATIDEIDATRLKVFQWALEGEPS